MPAAVPFRASELAPPRENRCAQRRVAARKFNSCLGLTPELCGGLFSKAIKPPDYAALFAGLGLLLREGAAARGVCFRLAIGC